MSHGSELGFEVSAKIGQAELQLRERVVSLRRTVGHTFSIHDVTEFENVAPTLPRGEKRQGYDTDCEDRISCGELPNTELEKV